VVDGKEAHVFDHPGFEQQTNKTEFADKIYKSKLSNYQNQQIVCDATPITVFCPEFMQACYQYNPEAKFILILRDPVERAISHYCMSQNRSLEKRSMLRAFLSEPFRLRSIKKARSWEFDSPFRNHSYLSRGCYSQQLRNLYSMIPKKQVLVLHQKELKKHHNAVMLKIFEFLAIPPHDITGREVFESAKTAQPHDITPSEVFVSEKLAPHSGTKPSKILISDKKALHRSDTLAKLYARMYFFIHRENPKQWDKLINS
jgi:hypothetical protein